MDLVRRRSNRFDPVDEFDRLQREINALFDFAGMADSPGIFDRSIAPPLDVVETDEALIITCDLPGMSEKDVELSVAAGALTIKGEKKREEIDEEARVYRRETWDGTFQRMVSLPTTADIDRAEAEFENGVLTVTIPRKEEAKPKKIELKTK